MGGLRPSSPRTACSTSWIRGSRRGSATSGSATSTRSRRRTAVARATARRGAHQTAAMAVVAEEEPSMPDSGPIRSRPNFPGGYGVDRSASDQMLEWQVVEARLAESRNYWVCTASPSGRPHAAPVWGLWFEGALGFSTDPSSRKGRDLEQNPVCVVHLESGDDAVIVEGDVERLTDRELLDRFVDAYQVKYGIRPDPADPGFGFYRLRPASVFAWMEHNFVESA